MIDVTTSRPLRVSTEGTAGPYIRVPVSQLEEIRLLFEDREIRHRVQENVISLDGGPEIAVIDLGRGADPNAVQAILDSAP